MSKPEPNEKDSAERSLLWDCFVNWAITLKKLEKKEVAERSSNP
jgi:hypothetical protein